MNPLVCSTGPWTAAVLVDSVIGRYEPTGCLEDKDLAGPGESRQGLATVEMRRRMGGITPRALVAGEFVPDSSGWFKVRVATSGDLPEQADHDCPGLLGSDLATGLPDEFAHAVVNGLVRFGPELNRSGLLEVVGAGFDEVDSSEFAFEHVAGLLKWALLGVVGEASSADLASLLASWGG